MGNVDIWSFHILKFTDTNVGGPSYLAVADGCGTLDRSRSRNMACIRHGYLFGNRRQSRSGPEGRSSTNSYNTACPRRFKAKDWSFKSWRRSIPSAVFVKSCELWCSRNWIITGQRNSSRRSEFLVFGLVDRSFLGLKKPATWYGS